MHVLSHSLCTMTGTLTPFLLVFPLHFSHRIPISWRIQRHLHMSFPGCTCDVPLIALGWLMPWLMCEGSGLQTRSQLSVSASHITFLDIRRGKLTHGWRKKPTSINIARAMKQVKLRNGQKIRGFGARAEAWVLW